MEGEKRELAREKRESARVSQGLRFAIEPHWKYERQVIEIGGVRTRGSSYVT